jgi:hypothetical protein
MDQDEMKLEHQNMKSQLTTLNFAAVNTSDRVTKLDEKLDLLTVNALTAFNKIRESLTKLKKQLKGLRQMQRRMLDSS